MLGGFLRAAPKAVFQLYGIALLGVGANAVKNLSPDAKPQAPNRAATLG